MSDLIAAVATGWARTGIGILRKEGCEVRNRDFFRIGLPFTFTAVIIGYLFIWFVWG